VAVRVKGYASDTCVSRALACGRGSDALAIEAAFLTRALLTLRQLTSGAWDRVYVGRIVNPVRLVCGIRLHRGMNEPARERLLGYCTTGGCTENNPCCEPVPRKHARKVERAKVLFELYSNSSLSGIRA